MSYRTFSMAALAATLFVSSFGWAAEDAEESMTDGKFVSVSGTKLTMIEKDGTEHSHVLAVELKVTCDGIRCNATDLKAGAKIRVTTNNAEKKVTNIEAIDQHTRFANTYDGKFVSLVENKLTITDSTGTNHSYTVAKGATLTCDGKDCTSDHLKVGMKIRVTTKKDDMGVLIHVEALDKNPQLSRIH